MISPLLVVTNRYLFVDTQWLCFRIVPTGELWMESMILKNKSLFIRIVICSHMKVWILKSSFTHTYSLLLVVLILSIPLWIAKHANNSSCTRVWKWVWNRPFHGLVPKCFVVIKLYVSWENFKLPVIRCERSIPYSWTVPYEGDFEVCKWLLVIKRFYVVKIV